MPLSLFKLGLASLRNDKGTVIGVSFNNLNRLLLSFNYNFFIHFSINNFKHWHDHISLFHFHNDTPI